MQSSAEYSTPDLAQGSSGGRGTIYSQQGKLQSTTHTVSCKFPLQPEAPSETALFEPKLKSYYTEIIFKKRGGEGNLFIAFLQKPQKLYKVIRQTMLGFIYSGQH